MEKLIVTFPNETMKQEFIAYVDENYTDIFSFDYENEEIMTSEGIDDDGNDLLSFKLQELEQYDEDEDNDYEDEDFDEEEETIYEDDVDDEEYSEYVVN